MASAGKVGEGEGSPIYISVGESEGLGASKNSVDLSCVCVRK